ncbi:hypothetical protein PMI10_04364 [Flavobacterium sp. CF136]|nr:hypothetical protein PMI10_04364 [Flavobacterium sp. CF136]
MLCYGLVDYLKIKYGRFIILSIFLSLFLIIFPFYFHLPEEAIQNYCGFYYYFDYFHTYWNIGITTVLTTHVIYCYLLNRKSKKNN